MYRPAALVLVLLMFGLSACGAGGESDACGPVRSETLDRRSLIHVLPGAPAPSYLTDPPTSGPHQPSPPVQGRVDRPIDRPVQVGILEAGQVLLQHRGLSAAERRELESLAGPKVVVAPNSDLPAGDKVVATAWLTKKECRTVDLVALRDFTETYQDNAPGSDG